MISNIDNEFLRHEQRLKSILDTNNNIVVAIYGDWGVGKTHFWKKFCNEHYKDDNIYISLIGKSDIVAIKENLILNLTNRNKAICKIKNIRFALNLGIVSFNSSVGNLFDLIGKENFSNKIICFDDLERMDSRILQGVLGLINELKEHKECKIVLIFNKSKLNSTDFFAKDKIIDREIMLNPSAESSLKIAKSGLNINSTAELIIKNYCIDKGITNIRVIRRIFDDFMCFEKEINCDFGKVAPQILDILVRFSTINAMEIGVDLMRLHFFYFVKLVDTHNYEHNVNNEFSTNEIALFERYFHYIEGIGNNFGSENIANIITKFINTESLSDRDKAEIVNFRL